MPHFQQVNAEKIAPLKYRCIKCLFNYAGISCIINCTWWINSLQPVVVFYFRVTRTVFQDRWLPVEIRTMVLPITAPVLYCNIL